MSLFHTGVLWKEGGQFICLTPKNGSISAVFLQINVVIRSVSRCLDLAGLRLASLNQHTHPPQPTRGEGWEGRWGRGGEGGARRWGSEGGRNPVGVGVTLYCLHNFLRTSGWIFTKFIWIYLGHKKEQIRF